MDESTFQKTLIIISSVHWHFTWQRHHDIAVGFAKKGYNVLFIEPIPKRWPTFKEFFRVVRRVFGFQQGGGTCYQEIPNDIQVVSPMMLPDTSQISYWINKKIFIPWFFWKKIRHLVGHRPRYLINYLPIHSALRMQELMAPDLAVYDCVSDWKNNPNSPKNRLVEDILIETADLVFADSSYLYQKIKRKKEQVYQILPAVHYKMFKSSKINGQSENKISRPIVGYFGTIGHYIDVDLLRDVSKEYQLHLIGPTKVKLENFSERTKYYGAVSHEKLPPLLEDLDVILLPYIEERMPFPAVIPAKTFECLATGKPVVVIGLKSLSDFDEYFYICETKKEFFKSIDEAYNEPLKSREKRLALAKKNDWTERINEIETLLLEYQEQKGSWN